MKAETSVLVPDLTSEQSQLVAVETQIAELRHAIDHTIDDVQKSVWSSISGTGLSSGPRPGRGRPPKFTPQQRQLLVLKTQFTKLRAELEETLSIIDVQKELRTL